MHDAMDREWRWERRATRRDANRRRMPIHGQRLKSVIAPLEQKRAEEALRRGPETAVQLLNRYQRKRR